ncbi:MAG: acetyltransferase [Gammaproteobacteria bacterium]
MFLKQKTSGHMVEIINLPDLMNLNRHEVVGRYQEGEEEQDPETFDKTELVFLSGEALPRCWTDPHYRDEELTH